MNFSSSIVKSILESDELQQSLESVVDLKLDILKQDLINAGLDKDKVSEIFEKSSEKRNTMKKVEVSSEKILGEKYSENSPKTSSKRFLKPNYSVGNYEKEEKPQVNKDNEIVDFVLNYGKSSHALFGPFNKDYKSFKDSYLSRVNWIKPNSRLAFGFGWLITPLHKDGEEKESLQQRCDKVEMKLKKAKIPYRKIQRIEYEKEYREKKNLEEDLGNSQIEPEKTTKNEEPKEESKIEPKKTNEEKSKKEVQSKTRDDKKKLVLESEPNKWGNIYEKETGYVFVNLPVGRNGKELPVAIGWQQGATPLSCNGLVSVYPLTEDMKKECECKKWNFLNEKIINITKKRNSSLATKYEEFMNKPQYVEEEDFDEEDFDEEDFDEEEEEEEEEEDVEEDDEDVD